MNNFQELTLPGVSFSQKLLDIAQREKPTSLPVFIGYGPDGDSPLQLMEIHSMQSFMLYMGDQDCPGYLSQALNLYFLHGGGRCYVLLIARKYSSSFSAADFDGIDEIISSESSITLIVLPDIVLLDSESWQSVVSNIAQCCASNLNLFGLIDFPNTQAQAKECCDLISATGHEHLAGYWPWVYLQNEASVRIARSRSEELFPAIPPCAAVAAIYQLNDKTRGVWHAPANLRLDKVIKTQSDKYEAFGLFHSDSREGCSVNPLRSFPGRGIKVWGCRTLSRLNDPAKLYVQNQRLLKWIKATLRDVMRPYVYEPNNEITWYRLHALIRSHLKSLWQKGGLAGQTEDEAWSIQIGIDETMTPQEIEQGLLRCRVAVALQEPAEFIYLNLDFWLDSTLKQTSGVTP